MQTGLPVFTTWPVGVSFSVVGSTKFDCVRIAQQIAHSFGIELDKDVVRRILAKHFRRESGNGGPSWLSFIGYTKDSLWSIDLLRCESILLCSHLGDVGHGCVHASACRFRRRARQY